jgi:SSS family solute:Na+ symporter
MHVIDVSIVVSYLLVCLILGCKKFGQVKTLQEYALGTKSFTTSVLIATVFATAINAFRTVGYVGTTYKLGIVFIATMCFIPIWWFVMARLLANNLNFFRQKNFMTLGDIMEHWYGKLGRHITSVAAIFLTLGITAVSNIAIGDLVHFLFGVPKFIGIMLAMIIVTAYSTFGGLRAVAFTDVFQFLVFFIALPIVCAIGLQDVGGFKNMLNSLPETHLKIGSENIGLFLSLLVYAIVPNADIPHIQRALVAKNGHQLRTTFSVAAMLMIPLYAMIALIGLITYIKAPDIDPEYALFYFTKYYLPVGAFGLMIAGLLAIIMSTQDSFLNSTSVLISRDICKQIWPKLNTKRELLIARSSCIVLSVLSISLAFVKEDIVSLIWSVANFWDPFVVVPFVMALIGVRINKKLFFIIPIITLITQVITYSIVGKFGAKSFAVGLITAIIVTFVVSRFDDKQAQEEAAW